MEAATLTELAKAAVHPLGFAAFALAALLLFLSRHWNLIQRDGLAGAARLLAVLTLVGGFILAYLTVEHDSAVSGTSADEAASSPKVATPGCNISGSGNTITASGSGRAILGVCGDVK